MVSLNMSKTYLAAAVLRVLQFVFAVTVIGLYGQDLNAAHKAGKYTDSKWVCFFFPSYPLTTPPPFPGRFMLELESIGREDGLKMIWG